MGVKVGVRVGKTVAVPVAGAAGDGPGVATQGSPQPAKTDTTRSQGISFMMGKLVNWWVGFID
jgi:hypothetical protein